MLAARAKPTRGDQAEDVQVFLKESLVLFPFVGKPRNRSHRFRLITTEFCETSLCDKIAPRNFVRVYDEKNCCDSVWRVIRVHTQFMIGLSHCCVKRRFGVLVYCVVFGCTTTDGCGRSLHFFPKCMRT